MGNDFLVWFNKSENTDEVFCMSSVFSEHKGESSMPRLEPASCYDQVDMLAGMNSFLGIHPVRRNSILEECEMIQYDVS